MAATETDVATQLAERLARSRQPRPVFTYPVPKGVSEDFTSIGLVELRIDEEETAIRTGGRSVTKQVEELCKAALHEVNGKPVSPVDNSLDRAWNTFPSKLRKLIEVAYNKIHMPEDEEVTDFLKGQQVRVS